MKKFLAVLLAFSLCFLLSGCALFDLAAAILRHGREEDAPVAAPSEIENDFLGELPALSESEESEPSDSPDSSESPDSFASALNVQQVGSQELGYLEVPDDWVRFFDLNGTTALQYSDPAKTSIITMDIFDFSDLSEEEKSTMTAENVAGSVWYVLENTGVTDITGARVTLDGLDALQVYGSFVSEDYGLDSYIICWVFEGGDGVYHYLAAEAAEEDIMDVVSYVENTYHLNAAE